MKYMQNEKLMKDFYPALRPLAWLYGCIVRLRNKLFDWHILPSEKFPVPVICIGNLTVGGTGKTPHTEYLAGRLRKERRVAVLSRGYKRRSRGFVLANEVTTAEELGDEPFQIKQKFPDVLVAVDANRRRGIRLLLSLPPEIRPEVILLDDAFQHRYVIPSLSILLTDNARLFTQDYLLPAGRLREPQEGVGRADIVIVTKCPSEMNDGERRRIREEIGRKATGKPIYFTRIEYQDLQPVFPEKASALSLRLGKDDGVLLVSGIANPQPLVEKMKKQAGEVELVAFADHHAFGSEDLRQVEERFGRLRSKRKYIITTEKDAARLLDNPWVGEALKLYLYYIPISISFCGEGEKEFIEQIKQKI